MLEKGSKNLSVTGSGSHLNSFGGQLNSKRRCWYMYFKSSLVPHPKLKLVNKFAKLIKFGNLNLTLE